MLVDMVYTYHSRLTNAFHNCTVALALLELHHNSCVRLSVTHVNHSFTINIVYKLNRIL